MSRQINLSSVRVEINGNRYSTQLVYDIRSAIEQEGVTAFVRGSYAPAAGPDIAIDLVLSIVEDITTNLIIELGKRLFARLKEVMNKHRIQGSSVTKFSVQDISCDYVISANSAAGVNFELIQLERLLGDMRKLVTEEAACDRIINRVDAPCDLQRANQPREMWTTGIGSYSVWHLSYSSGDRWPDYLYDAANQVFIPLTNSELKSISSANQDNYFTDVETPHI